MPPGCEDALLACDLLFPKSTDAKVMLRDSWVFVSAARNHDSYPDHMWCLILWRQPGPAQPSPRLPFCTKNQALEKNLKNMNKCAQMTPKCYKKVCKNDTLQRMECQAIPRTTKNNRKNDLRANTLHALVFDENDTKKLPKLVP